MRRTLLRFGPFELDEATGELRRSGMRVRMQPQPLRVLHVLAARQGELVTREELRHTVWGDGTFVDFEHGLNYCIAQVRRALGDSAGEPRFVETVPRAGYRFVAPVERIERVDRVERADRIQGPAPAAPAPQAARRAWTWAAWRLVVVALLGLSMSAGDGGVSVSATLPEPSPAAHDAYVKGLYHTQRGPAEWAEGVRWLERAVRDEPSFAAAQAALAGAYVQLAAVRLRPGREVFPLAATAAAAALRGGSDPPEAHVWLAVARLNQEWDWDGAERELRRAVSLAPRLAVAHRTYASLLSARGDDAAALAEIAEARKSDPLCPILTGEAARLHYRARRYEEAAALWRTGLVVRDDSGGHEGLFHVYLQERDLGPAAAEALRVMSLVGVPEDAVRSVGRRPPAEVARLFLKGAVEHLDRPGSYALPDRLAILHASLGDRGRALSELETAFAERSPELLAALRDPAFDGLRDEPRFRRIVAAVGRS
jgi:DNA-binding winged helix-turn-helix (wHTH) protein